ncbi:MAG: MerR family transcriptional regulator [bacterium]|nr:MerR family transcriptional regulator [bacterium]
MNFENKNTNKFYLISEAADKTDVATHTLRYWEKNGLLVPLRTQTGRRRYSEDQISEIVRLKKLIYDEKLTTVAVKKRLKIIKSRKLHSRKETKLFLRGLKADIKQVLKMLK